MDPDPETAADAERDFAIGERVSRTPRTERISGKARARGERDAGRQLLLVLRRADVVIAEGRADIGRIEVEARESVVLR